MSETAEQVVEIRRRSRSEAEQLVTEYESSGLTRASFCAGRGLSVGTLDSVSYTHLDVYKRQVGKEVGTLRQPGGWLRSSHPLKKA